MMKSQRAKRFLSRRDFLRDTALVAAAIGAGTLGRGFQAAHAGDAAGPLLVAQGAPGELYTGNWKTWVLRSGREIGVPRPEAATSAQGTRELAQLKRAQVERTEAQINAARFWDTGPATRRWTEIHLEMIKSHRPNPPRGRVTIHPIRPNTPLPPEPLRGC